MIEILLSIASSGIWSKVWTVAVAILFFGVIIMIHECGHFLFAKLFKVKVNEFSIGMGPAVFKRKKGETQYSVRVLPIGGYVSMEGEDQDSDDDGAFNKKPVWQKMIIVAAGAFMNLLLGVIIMCIMLSTSGDLIGTNTIKSFYDGAVSEQYGLKEGDRFLEIDGHHVWSERDLSFLMSRSKDGVFDFVVERDGQKVELSDVHFDTEQQDGITLIKYDFVIIGEKPNFLNVVKNSFTQSASVVRMVWLSLFDLVTGRYGMSELAGPVGTVNVIADVTASAASSKNLGSLLALYPKPMTVVGAEVEGRVNWLVVGHTGIIGHDRILVSMNKNHYTNRGIWKSGKLSINLVSRDMLPKADHVGSVSGATVDKSEAFACRTHNPTVRRKKTYALKHRRRAPQRDTATTYTFFGSSYQANSG